MEPKLVAAQRSTGSAGADTRAAVTALYQAHAVGLIGLAVVMMLSDRHAADVVQDAFPRYASLCRDCSVGC
jgi:DNA-directed RNA polymerase specialized sigma24 family protein